MRTKQFLLTSIVPAFLMVFTNCSTAPRVPESTSSPAVALLDDSFIDISYVFEHDLHRVVLEAKNGKVLGESFLDRKALKQNNIEKERYSDLYTRVASFVETARRQPASSVACRSPFVIVISHGNNKQTLKGCRTSESGTSFGRLSRDAEFLLYSKK